MTHQLLRLDMNIDIDIIAGVARDTYPPPADCLPASCGHM